MTEVVISPLAAADMTEIADYISREKRSPGAALRLIRRFRKEITALSTFPLSGSQLIPPGSERCPYRYIVCGNYLIFYHVNSERVMVDRVLYGRRDYMALLFGDVLSDEDDQ